MQRDVKLLCNTHYGYLLSYYDYYSYVKVRLITKKCSDRISKHNDHFNKQNLLFCIVSFISLAKLLCS